MDQAPNTILPEINILNQDDWDFLSKPPPATDKEEQQQQQQQQQPSKDTPPSSTSDSESITTGLTRALSLPRQLNKTADSSTHNNDDGIRTEVINIATANPSHLFWVPASQHPEIAPTEFEKYVDAHGLMIRKKSVKRRQSVLSVYFTASDHQKLMEECDTAEAEKDRQAALSMLESKHHTQKESNGSEPEPEEEDTKKRKTMLRRSVSLHFPTTGEYPRNVPDLLVFDRNSSPLDESRALVPKGDRPLLRRGARTNFKRNSSLTAPQRNRKSESDSMGSLRRLDENSDGNIVRSTSAEGVTLSDALGEETSTTNGEAVLLMEEPLPMLSPVAENEEVRDLCIAKREEASLASPSPPAPVVMARSVSTSTASSNQSRKSAWSWAFWSDEKSSKKNNKIDPNATAATAATANTANTSTTTASAATTEDDKTADTTTTAPATTGSNSNKRFTLSSLFSRKSKSSNNNQSSASYTTNFDLFLDDQKKAPKDFQLNRMHMTRLPLHVERAIYKLSHVKLANPRRPLHEQVLISNQMFWYLSVIATNAPHPASSAYDMSSEDQPQRKAPRKRLVKKQKQRPVSAPQQPQQHHRQQPSLTKNRTSSHTANSNPKGNTPMFMANPRTATNESTGFVVPENYLNPKQQQQQQEQIQQQQQQKKKPTMGNSINKKVPLYHKQQQGSDSSSSDDDDDDDDDDSDDDDNVASHGQEPIAEKIVISHSEKEDELPLAMYKSNAYNKKIK